jgi:hypothetical protein
MLLIKFDEYAHGKMKDRRMFAAYFNYMQILRVL